MNDLINKGSIVRIKRGSFVNKGVDGGLTKRSYTVTVHRVARGITAVPQLIVNDDWFRDQFVKSGGDIAALEHMKEHSPFEYHNMEIEVTPSSIIWAGSGGYWRNTSIENVELVRQA